MFKTAGALGCALLATALVGRFDSHLQAKPQDIPPEKQQEKTAEQQFKNIQLLKGVPASQIIPAMRFMANSLGVGCDFCHVSGDNGGLAPDKDVRKEKETARKMIAMTREINQRNFDGRMEVTCATCHQGHEHPNAVPPVEFAAASEAHAPEGAEPKLPAAKSLFERYAQALGGEKAQQLTSRVTKAVLVESNGRETPVEIHEKAPDKYLLITTLPAGTRRIGFSGGKGWIEEGRQKREIGAGLELQELARRADYFREFRLAEHFPRATVRAKENVGDREAWVVTGRSSPEVSARMFFDIATGLLLRQVVLTRTPLGPLPDEAEYADYREVDGIKLPFSIRRYDRGRPATLKVTSVKHNVPLADSEFEAPADGTQ